MQQEFIDALVHKAETDARILALWLEGSLGRGNADRYSDVDAHLLLNSEDAGSFAENAREWLNEVAPLVLFSSRFDGQMLNCLTGDGLRLDLWRHVGESVTVEKGKALVLLDRDSHVTLVDAAPIARSPAETRETLERQLGEFWRCLSLLPTVIGRDEKIVGFSGLAVEIGPLTDILLIGEGIARDRGVKTLNRYLAAEARQEVEAALSLIGLTAESVARAHLRLAAIVQRRGPVIAERIGAIYPRELEQTVVAYVSHELRFLGLASCLNELHAA